ncbi:ABC transporter permease subunit, partial [Rhizobium leguminosarum]
QVATYRADVTIQVSMTRKLSILIGAAIGLVVAFALTSKRRFAIVPARVYVTVIRNLPILVLVIFAFFAMPQMGLRLDKIKSFVLVL